MPSPEISDDRKIADPRSPEHQADLVAVCKQIKNAFRASMFIGGFIHTPICFGLGYGISRNNALCAKLMFGYYLLVTILSIKNQASQSIVRKVFNFYNFSG